MSRNVLFTPVKSVICVYQAVTVFFFLGVSEVRRIRACVCVCVCVCVCARAYGNASCDLVSASDNCVTYATLIYHGLKPVILYCFNTFSKIYGIPCNVNVICTTYILF